MTDTTSSNTSDEFRALTILAFAVAETLGQQGLGEKFLVNLMRVIEDQRSKAPDGDRAIVWADRLATELLIG
jgi:hypothetical protein